MALFDRVHDVGRLITFMDYRITSLQEEIDASKSRGGLKAVVAAEERATELEKELEETKRERDEVLQRLEISDKELNEAQGDLSKAQRQLKEARVRAQRADDELLKSMKELESARVKLPKRAIDDYKGSAGFKEYLKRMEVEEDPFTIQPEDDSMPMERQQAFDDSDSPES
ncbi:hypothetical protein B296_00016040 [Ensete ventricosum]|uniref:Uncharacterized protein n=1 Tax=Ensete ventricosum TaxID=4639 RepID=A0A427B6F9_ENSVE|nr:hypothetical protein B296_00016040 [Ensete ventricosum]